MSIKSRNPIVDEVYYEEAARDYCRSLPLEHFMESTPTSTQRAITLASFALIRAARPDVHVFNELLIQYPVGDIHTIGRVVPDNMVVTHDGPIRAEGSFNTPFEEAKPFLVMEYVSEGNKRKDYADNFRRYEQDLRVPHYLLFEPHKHLLNLFKLTTRRKYSSVKPNREDRLDAPELELEVGTLDDWVRFWFRGKLLPLPAELAAELAEAKKRLRQAERRAEAAEAELERLRAELKKLKGNGGRSG
jgi:Uma2 family endonuclease